MANKLVTRETILRILDLARWAPSGDNTQPWRFEILADNQVIVHGHDTRDAILYDFDGHASHMAHGALLETIRIAASAEGFAMTWDARADQEWRKVQYDIRFTDSPEVELDPLYPFIEKRTVQRRSMQMTPLNGIQKDALAKAAGEQYEIQFFETFLEKSAIAKLLWDNAYIRLVCPEAFSVHQSIIEWKQRFSKDRIPERAVGIDPMTGKLMRWVMKSWGRVDFFNRYLLGTVVPRVQLDYIPAVLCAGHVLIKPITEPKHLEDWVCLGQTMQRFWLTATQIGLHLQPEMTPVIFRWYARSGRRFSAMQKLERKAIILADDFESLAKASKSEAFGFFCRVGISSVPNSRSLRLDLKDLFR